MIDGKWWDSSVILSHNANGNVVKAKREIGKSYGTLLREHARRVRNHEAMVWLRFTQEEADTLANSFGNGKWLEIWNATGMTQNQFKRKGRRILWRPNIKADWQPFIRYMGLSEWHNLRDNDDPQERFLFFDEYIVPDAKLRRYQGGRPADDFLDLWVSLRRGKDKMPFLLCGNPELGADWFLPAIGINDREKLEKITIYTPSDTIRDKCRDADGIFNLDRVAVEWTQNPNGHSAGGSASGLARSIPDGLCRKLCGYENLYAQVDFGDGVVSMWLGGDGIVIDTRIVLNKYVYRMAPDGSPMTRILPRNARQLFCVFRSFWLMGRVYYTGAEAFTRFSRYASKLI